MPASKCPLVNAPLILSLVLALLLAPARTLAQESIPEQTSDVAEQANSLEAPPPHIISLEEAAAASVLLVFDGDSLTQGSGASFENTYPDQTVARLPAAYNNYLNLGWSGQTLADMHADAHTQIDPFYSPSRPRNILVAWGGSNDLYYSPFDTDHPGADADGTYARLVTYAQSRRNAGWQVVVLTLLPRSGLDTPSTFESERQAVNQRIRANWRTFADALADVAAHPLIGDAGDESDLDYYTIDRVHLNNKGYEVVAGIVAPVVQSLPARYDYNLPLVHR